MRFAVNSGQATGYVFVENPYCAAIPVERAQPVVEDVLPTFISDQKPAYVAHPYAEQQMPHAIQHSCCLIVGPEGGFIPFEVDLFKKNGCQARRLGNRILRTETAVSHILGRLFI